MAKSPKSRQSGSQKCPNCGMPQNDWPNQEGFSEGDETYCCQGCADDSGCTCQ